MKLPITDQLLWDMYNFLDSAKDASRFLLLPPRTMSQLSINRNPVFEKYQKENGKRAFSKLIYYLKTNNYIKAKSLEGQKGVILTKRGLSKALKASFSAEKRVKREDGKWIMLMFDIPQKHPKARNLLHSVLYNLGYKMFQQSVWVTPYDVSEKTEQLLQMHSLDNYVKIFLIEEI
ncbi:MAG: hypothetical protein A3F47_01900 [Candidatus Staskawiczbacteria bacterium RIFCSPHIGHO2_12_FULL_38_11]|uniref:Transcriptional repressor PaaX-like central Cas2-like domain-containing protein n=1 Tax=Candidatus Staskawiczbacteria bacterium RIFCSPHIGHO2_12_FULL_38_11 TaxID=1802209 RepID=A0A1G2I848_9BACT|nr:MAG: hypothetical protein A3F47_01900 [Candidatus Staskawiczbacteria bacterium RIFCSPHIGHO2_12_FULL_38_11]